MKMTKIKGMGFALAALLMLSVSSCSLFELDVNTDPNNPAQASLELLLTNVELNASATFAGGLNDMASGFMAQSTSTDDFNMNNSTWNGTWNYLYSNPLNDLERIIVAAEAAGNNPHYLGVAQVLKAYYFSLMVDLWGDVPYSQAFKGDQGIKTPAYDDDAAIYADLMGLLDKAIANFALTSPVTVKGDVIYGGSIAKWRRAANSLKLRMLLQTSKLPGSTAAADIQALIGAAGANISSTLITAAADDFQFKFGRLQSPDDRHPWYINGYAGGEAAHGYFAHKFMFEMLNSRDPRTPFYFKRQTNKVLDPGDPTDKQTIPCSQREDCIFGYFVLNPTITQALFAKTPANLSDNEKAYLAGFFGRDRSDPSGVPNDNPIRTTVGAYPAAGLFDDVAELGGGNKGSGDGIFPMVSNWMVSFYLLEAQISLGVNTGKTDSQLLNDALTAQMAKVFSVGAAADAVVDTNVANWGAKYGWPITYKSQATFVADAVAGYPAAGTTNARLQYALKQAWFANFGNGYESYNAFRRTGLPNDLQAPLQLPRQFALRLPYVQDELNLNNSTPSIVYDSPSSAVFWDVLKFQF
jgi:hypothetical protein